MLGHRQLTFDDYLIMLRRRLWIILIPTIFAPLIAYLYSRTLPNRYTSKALVLVEGQKVPENYVRAVVTEDVASRMGTIQEQVLSRTRLQPLIEHFGLFKGDRGRISMDEAVAKLRASTTVKPVVTGLDRGNVPGFSIAFDADNPRLAQQVCAELTSMFLAENLRSRQQSAEGTNEFLKIQLETAKQKLDEQDAKLAVFKSKYIGQLPGQEQTNMNVLMGLNTQLDAATQAINRAQQDKTYAESTLATHLATWQASQKTGTANASTVEQQLAAMQSQLVSLEGRYTDNHPDVVKTKLEIEQLKRRLAEAQRATSTDTSAKEKNLLTQEPPQIQQLRMQIRQYDDTLRERAREQQRLEGQINIYQARVQLSPVVEEQYKELTRDYQSALNFYNELLAKKNQSEMATDLELRQQGERFRVMDPPTLPAKPSYPNRPYITAEGLGVGLGLGFAVALLLELLDRSLRTEQDVVFYLERPALALIPALDESPETQTGLRAWIRRKPKQAERAPGLRRSERASTLR